MTILFGDEKTSEKIAYVIDKDVRIKIIELLENIVSENPDISSDVLAKKVTAELDIDNEDLANFTLIEAINVLNRCHYSYTPIEDRILLIPHCLRNPEKCEAPIDDEGYHCLKCGACSISDITKAAEAHGLKWYMVGGGSHAVRIVKDVRPRAIFGIACFNEAMMAIEKFTEYNIPTQAVLLSKDGCVNTEVNFEEVVAKIDMEPCE